MLSLSLLSSLLLSPPPPPPPPPRCLLANSAMASNEFLKSPIMGLLSRLGRRSQGLVRRSYSHLSLSVVLEDPLESE